MTKIYTSSIDVYHCDVSLSHIAKTRKRPQLDTMTADTKQWKRGCLPSWLFLLALCVWHTSAWLSVQPTTLARPPSTLQAKKETTRSVQDAEKSSIGLIDSMEERLLMHDQIVSRRSALLGGALVATGAMWATAEATQAQERPETENSRTVTVDTSALLSNSEVAVVDWNGVFQKAGKKALGGGRAGASAAVVQVCSLMWLRTSMNYQYRYGGNLQSSLQTLWKEGGLARLYQGLPFALVQGPLTRFGDTAANVGILALLESLPQTQDWPLPFKTACASISAGLWRIVLMPIDASKTAMQVEGAEGLQRLWESVGAVGPGPLYRGALAQVAATTAGHFPWFLTYNFLNEEIPTVASSTGDDQQLLLQTLIRAAFLGLSASCVSDCISNSFRVIKTTKQTAQLADGSAASGKNDLSYPEIVSMIIEQDGLMGLLGRGLQTRLLTNSIQGAVFSVMWKYFQQVGNV